MTQVSDNLSKLARLLKRLGNFDLWNFKGRLLFQKRIYLLQALGLDLKYRFSWYIRGPYSPSLTKDGFALIPIYNELPTEPLTQNEQQIITRFLNWLSLKKEDEEWLELVSSIHFLKEAHWTDKNLIFRKLQSKMPSLTVNIFNEAWQKLEEVGLIK